MFKGYLLIVKLLIKVFSGVSLRDATIKGIPLIRIRGEYKIGAGLRLNSGLFWNPIGGANRMCLVVEPNAKLQIGKNFAASNCSIFCRLNIVIGNNVMVGGGARIWDTDFHDLRIERRLLQSDRGISRPIEIGDNVFIGSNSIILKGVIIGNDAVIGAGSVVHGDIPPNSVYAGNPAKEVKKLDEGSFVTREELFNDSSTYLQDLNIIEENMLGNNSFFGWIKSMFWPKK